jgi:hypothetical protein
MKVGRVALLWRADSQTVIATAPEDTRLRHLFAALKAAGIEAEASIFSEETVDTVRTQLESCDGVLAWVNPLSNGKTRATLDGLLRELDSRGVWVSAHPETILKIGTKEVLYRTRHLGWGADTYVYRTPDAFRSEFQAGLVMGQPRVLKQNRGNGGQGVWKVELLPEGQVCVLEALRGSVEEVLKVHEFVQRCEAYFKEDGLIIDQPYQPRLPEGMIRCYMCLDKVVGFGHQLIKALIPPPPEGPESPEAQPGPRIMHPGTAPQFQLLRHLMEGEWIPQMMEVVGLSRDGLPVIWDADFLYGPKNTAGEDSYVLCEINVSSVFPIPDNAPGEIAQAVADRLRRSSGGAS